MLCEGVCCVRVCCVRVCEDVRRRVKQCKCEGVGIKQ